MGMLATVMNALSMQSALEKINVPTRVSIGNINVSNCRTLYSKKSN